MGLGLPLVGSHLAQMAIVTTDTLMIGWYDIPSLAALSLAGGIWFIIFILGSGFGWAVMPMVASAIARNDEREVRRATRMGLWLSVLYGLAVIPIFFFFEPIFLFMGQEAEVARLAGQYMVWLGFAMLPALLVTVMRSYLSALELPRIILAVTLCIGRFQCVSELRADLRELGALPELGIQRGRDCRLLTGSMPRASCLLPGCAGAFASRPEHELFRNIHKPDWEFFKRVFHGWAGRSV